jgi:competence protein ComEC
MSPEVERDFVASGTMHLLAISGLHVGILYVFLVRVLNVLLVPRVPALMAAGLVCVLYAYLTDLRPSVVRATVFIQLLIAAQILRREVRMGSLIGVTTLLLVVMDPAIAFDSGAWLSFLAVGALGWVSFRTPPPRDEPAPPENISWQEQLHARVSQAGGWLRGSYRKMLTVTLLSAPLIAEQFHLVSLTGMVLNVVLIPYSAAVLIAGYVFVGLGHLMPFAAGLLSLPFEYGLQGLNQAVEFASSQRYGFLMIPDLPGWFLPAFYGLLLASCVARRRAWRQSLRVALATLVLVQFHRTCQQPEISETRCTVLSVGHGNAVLVESPQLGVVLFDAGALSRSERAADIISRCLWNRGHRMIDAIVVSHADADHYNALPPLLEVMPVGQIITTPQFVRSAAKEVVDLLAAVEELGVPVTLAFSGDSVVSSTAELSTRFLQASEDAAAGDDNGSSLVAMLTTPLAEICLPGDLDGEGQQELLPALRRSDAEAGSGRPRFLVAPHHGSRGSNPPGFATAVAADTVIISSRDNVNADAMRAVYAPAKVWFTALNGAVTIGRGESGAMEVEGFVTGREDDRRREREGASEQDDEPE